MAGVQADQHLVVRLGQGIQRHQAFGVADGSRIVAPLFQQQRQAEQRVRQLAAVMFALGEKPVVVKAAQQIVLVEARGFFKRRALAIRIASFGGVRRARERGIEFHDVDGAGGVAAPLHAVVVRLQVATFRRQRAAQVMEQLTEIGAGLRLDGFRPKEKCQLFARLRRLAIEDQPGQQGLQAVGVDRQDGLLRAGDQQIVEQLDAHRHLAAPPTSGYPARPTQTGSRSYHQSLLSLDGNAYWELYPQTSQVTVPALKLETVPSPSGEDALKFSTRS